MEHPVRTAFCVLLFIENGGQQDTRGNPSSSEKIRSLCNKPYDCSECGTMQGSLRLLPPDEVFGWECVYCLEENKIIQRRLPGYFTSGTCWICGFETSFLQLVIRRKGA